MLKNLKSNNKKRNCLSKGVFLFLSSCAIVLVYSCLPVNLNADDAVLPQSDKVSLDLKDVGIVDLLRMLSLKTGKTIVASKEVTGRITIYLNNTTFSDALDIILLTQGLACEKRGDIYYVMSSNEYKRIFGKDYIEIRKLKTFKLKYAKPSNVFNALSQLKSDIGKVISDEASGTIIVIDIPDKLEVLDKTIKELDQPLETVVYDLNYAKPADAKTQISAAITQGTGEVIVDERSGKAIVSDLPNKLNKVGRMVKEIDEESRQVFIESDIVEVTLSDNFQRGIDWEKVFTQSLFLGADVVGHYPLVLDAFQKLTVGTLANDKYTAVLQFLQTYGNVKTISQPRIAVVNNEEASVLVGTREAYISTSQSQATSTTVTSESVQFIDVGVKLKVIPRIGKDGFITMKIKPEVSSVSRTITTTAGSQIPIVQTSEAESVVKVKDGTMIMIAGLIKEQQNDTVKGVPVLSQLPFLRVLFGSREKSITKSELIVFLRPRLTNGASVLIGTEPQKLLPADAIPEDIKEMANKEKIMSQYLQEAESIGGKRATEAKIKEEIKQSKQEKPKEKPKEEKPKEKPKTEEKPKPEEKPKEQKVEKPKEKIAVIAPLNEVEAKQSQTNIELSRDSLIKGLALQSSGNLDEALLFYQKAAALNQNYVPAYNQMGIVYEAQGARDKAKKMYLKAMTIDPGYLPVYTNLALVSESMDNKAEAIKYWRKRLELGNPDDPWSKEAIKHLGQLEGVSK